MNLNQAEATFREIISMYENAELDKEQFVSLLLNINADKIVTYNAEELQRKEQLESVIAEELRKTE